jgi:hypothetical protein
MARGKFELCKACGAQQCAGGTERDPQLLGVAPYLGEQQGGGHGGGGESGGVGVKRQLPAVAHPGQAVAEAGFPAG